MFPFDMAGPDVRELTPSLVLLLTDGFTNANRLFGDVTVKIGQADASFRKDPESTFVFLGLNPGQYTISVGSEPDTPYYQPVDIPIALPFKTLVWPAYPDRGLANLNLMLDDATQPSAYRTQRRLAALKPSTAYPFPAGATLVRGVVKAGKVPLSGATVVRSGETFGYQTGTQGEYVLFFDRVKAPSESVTLIASHPTRPDVTATVDVVPARTVSLDIVMAP